jgi:hypothetical protein
MKEDMYLNDCYKQYNFALFDQEDVILMLSRQIETYFLIYRELGCQEICKGYKYTRFPEKHGLVSRLHATKHPRMCQARVEIGFSYNRLINAATFIYILNECYAIVVSTNNPSTTISRNQEFRIDDMLMKIQVTTLNYHFRTKSCILHKKDVDRT